MFHDVYVPSLTVLKISSENISLASATVAGSRAYVILFSSSSSLDRPCSRHCTSLPPLLVCTDSLGVITGWLKPMRIRRWTGVRTQRAFIPIFLLLLFPSGHLSSDGEKKRSTGPSDRPSVLFTHSFLFSFDAIGTTSAQQRAEKISNDEEEEDEC